MFRLAHVLLLLLFAYQFVGQAADASSVPREEPSSNCSGGCSKRTLASITWGCISTTLICAWMAIHPNIPPREGPFKATLRSLELMFWAFVAPECLPACALNQRMAAMGIRDSYNDNVAGCQVPCGIWETVKEWFSWDEIKEAENERWTIQHGFFVVMGGIHLVEPVEETSTPQKENPGTSQASVNTDVERGRPCRTKVKVKGRVTILTKEMLEALKSDIIKEIKVTKEEIADTSKGDALSKTIFILQSSWFVLQCIARIIQGLALTQLELTTLALASLNGITLLLWWEKPLGARTVVRVYVKRKLSFTERAVAERGYSYRSTLFLHLHATLRAAAVLIRDLVLRRPSAHIYVDWFVGLPLAICILLFFPVHAVVTSCLYNLGDVVMGGSTSFPHDAAHVPPAYAPKHAYSEYWHPFLMMVLATVFGGIHCAGWNFLFPTHQDQKLWRLASLSVTTIPLVLIIIFFVIKSLLKYIYDESSLSAENTIAGFAAVSFAIMYLTARFIILGQAIAFMTHQPPSAFTAVEWSRFYPHLF